MVWRGQQCGVWKRIGRGATYDTGEVQKIFRDLNLCNEIVVVTQKLYNSPFATSGRRRLQVCVRGKSKNGDNRTHTSYGRGPPLPPVAYSRAASASFVAAKKLFPDGPHLSLVWPCASVEIDRDLPSFARMA